MTVKHLFAKSSSQLMTIAPSSNLLEAVKRLARDDTSALVVTEDERQVLGIVSSSNIVAYLNKHRRLAPDLKVADLMTKKVVAADIRASVKEVEALMTRHHIRHIPILNEKGLCGIVSTLDVLNYRAKMAETEARDLRDYVSGKA